MVTLNIADRDRTLLKQSFEMVLRRRRKLSDWDSITFQDLYSIYLPVWLQKEIATWGEDEVFPFLRRRSHIRVHTKIWKKGFERATLNLRADKNDLNFPYSDDIYSGCPVVHSKSWPKVRKWALSAFTIEYQNLVAEQVFRKLLDESSTFNKLYKYSPETMAAITNHLEHVRNESGSSHWFSERDYDAPASAIGYDATAMSKLFEVNKHFGATEARSRKVSVNVATEVKKYRNFMETLAAGAILLGPDTSIGDTPLRGTWVSGIKVYDVI